MKRKTCFVLLCLCAAAGAVRVWDMAAFTEAGTGFVTAGSVWLRYGALAAMVAVVCAAARLWPARETLPQLAVPAPLVFVLLAAACVGCGVMGVQNAVTQFAYPTTSFGQVEAGPAMRTLALLLRLAFGVSMLLCGVWCALLCLRRDPLKNEPGPARILGYFSVIGFLVLPVLLYAEHPASVHRTVRILPLCAALACVLFVVKWLGVLCAPLDGPARAALAAAGLCAFLLGTCVLLPQMVWQLMTRTAEAVQLWRDAVLVLTGVAGACVAWAVSEAPQA